MKKVSDKSDEVAKDDQVMSDQKFKDNPFMKKTTVKLDQDKSKFTSDNAKIESAKVDNPFLK